MNLKELSPNLSQSLLDESLWWIFPRPKLVGVTLIQLVESAIGNVVFDKWNWMEVTCDLDF